MRKPMRSKTKFAIWAVVSFLVAVGIFAEGHGFASGIMVLVGFCFVFLAGTSKN